MSVINTTSLEALVLKKKKDLPATAESLPFNQSALRDNPKTFALPARYSTSARPGSSFTSAAEAAAPACAVF